MHAVTKFDGFDLGPIDFAVSLDEVNHRLQVHRVEGWFEPKRRDIKLCGYADSHKASQKDR
jgi:hypothetical protein